MDIAVEGLEPDSVQAPALPEPRRIVVGLVGTVALGAAGALGAGGGGVMAVPSGLWSGLGAMALTAPALLVAHQFLRGRAAPEAVVASLGQAIVRGGELALGLVPVQLFFSCTTARGTSVLGVLLAGTAIAALVGAARDLVDAERAGGASMGELVTARALSWAWASMTLLIGLRLGWGLL